MGKNQAKIEIWFGVAIIGFVGAVILSGDEKKDVVVVGDAQTEVILSDGIGLVADTAITIPVTETAKAVESDRVVISLPTPVVIGDTDVAEIVEILEVVTEVNNALGYPAVNDVIGLAEIMVPEELDTLISQVTEVTQVTQQVEALELKKNDLDPAMDISVISEELDNIAPSEVLVDLVEDSIESASILEEVLQTQEVELDSRGLKKSVTFLINETPVSKVNYSSINYMFGGGLVKESHVTYHVDGTKTVLKFWDAGSYLGKKQEELVYSSDDQMINKIVYSPYDQTIIFEKSYI
jgi:hypothetical protein